MSLIQLHLQSKIGPLYLVASEKGLKGVFWRKHSAPIITDLNEKTAHQELKTQILWNTKKQLEEYFEGQRTDFDLPFDIDGTDFQKRVWKRLSCIPYGTTCSYKKIAIELGDPNASRAVGTANGLNPLSIIVPCHRVISSNGTLGGYAGGLNIKTLLLNLEKTGRIN